VLVLTYKSFYEGGMHDLDDDKIKTRKREQVNFQLPIIKITFQAVKQFG
jgi:hypothetical protein